MGSEELAGRRIRRRASAPQGPPRPPRPAPAPDEAPAVEPRPARPSHRDHHGERGLRDLIGSGKSQLGVGGALRGRDVNRPTEEDLAAAERDIVIVRRHWKPPPG